jgi:spore coat protein A
MRRPFSLQLIIVLSTTLILSILPLPAFSQTPELLDPLTIPQWVNQLDGPPPVYTPTNITDNQGNLIRQDYVVTVTEFNEQILPTVDADGSHTGFGPTKVWGYGGEAHDPITGESLDVVHSSPGPTFKASRGVPVQVKWVNNLVDSEGTPLTHLFPIDPTLHWANPENIEKPVPPVTAPPYPPGYSSVQSPVPIVTHLHGGETPSASDGHPDAWWTADGIHGPAYFSVTATESNSAVYNYPNSQQPTTLWYHDHALGITRINVLSGLAGFYLLEDTTDPVAELLPSGEYEVPIIIQDRSFLPDGSFYYPTEGLNPTFHPYWQNSFLGNTIMVNGKVWPNMDVKQGQYRFRILNGSNSRTYILQFSNGMPFVQIGSDGGYLKTSVQLTSLIISPAERVDILVEFSNIPAGQKVILENTALEHSELASEVQTLGQVIQFSVLNEQGFAPKQLPSNLNPTLTGYFPSLLSPTKERILTLTDVPGPNGPLAILLDGQKWGAPISENPELGTTEDWIIVNPATNAHPIHVHLIQFQLISRQTFNATAYMADWTALNGDPPLNHSTINVDSLDPYLIGSPVGSEPYEQGWKDTVLAYTGQVTVIRLRFTAQDGFKFPFDATAGPGYVWHCHIIEHEDNEMMRPYKVVLPSEQISAWLLVLIVIVVVSVIGVLGLRYLRKRGSSVAT